MRILLCLRTLLLATVFVAVASACEYQELDGVGTRTADEEFPPQLDIATFEGCHRGELGQWRASGELVNNSAGVASYEVTVAFLDGETRLDEKSTWIRDLRSGERAVIDAGWWIESSDRVTSCEILLINRF